MFVPNSSPAKSVKEFIAYCKDNTGKATYASSGNGTSLHLSGELFKHLANVEMTHVPYRGGAPAINDLIPGRVDVIFGNMPSIFGHVRAAAVRGLAVTTRERVAVVPDLPTIAEPACPASTSLVVRLFRAGEDAGGDHREDQCRHPPRWRTPSVKSRFEDLGADPERLDAGPSSRPS